MVNTNAKMYSEVDGVLNAMDEEYRNKVPQTLKNLILKNKDNSMKIRYDITMPLTEQNISKEALSMIALIHLNYWCKNEEEKAELNRIFKENAIKNEEERKKLYSLDNIFKNKSVPTKEIDETQEASKDMQMIEYKESILKKIANFIKRIFNK